MRTSMKAERWICARMGMSETVAGRRWRGIVVMGCFGCGELIADEENWMLKESFRQEVIMGKVGSGYIEGGWNYLSCYYLIRKCAWRIFRKIIITD